MLWIEKQNHSSPHLTILKSGKKSIFITGSSCLPFLLLSKLHNVYYYFVCVSQQTQVKFWSRHIFDFFLASSFPLQSCGFAFLVVLFDCLFLWVLFDFVFCFGLVLCGFFVVACFHFLGWGALTVSKSSSNNSTCVPQNQEEIWCSEINWCSQGP